MSPRLSEVRLERGSKAPVGEERGDVDGRPGDHFRDAPAHSARSGKKRCGRDRAVVPRFRDAAEPWHGVLMDGGQALHRDGEELFELVAVDRGWSSRKERRPGFPDTPAFVGIPVQRCQAPGRPARPRIDDVAIYDERPAERGAPPQEIGPLLAKVQSRERIPQAWIDISTT